MELNRREMRRAIILGEIVSKLQIIVGLVLFVAVIMEVINGLNDGVSNTTFILAVVQGMLLFLNSIME